MVDEELNRIELYDNALRYLREIRFRESSVALILDPLAEDLAKISMLGKEEFLYRLQDAYRELFENTHDT